MHAREIEPRLKQLITLASVVEPVLAKRLEEIWRWIKDIKSGSLLQKKFLMGFLLELIKDAEIWLELEVLNPDERQYFLDQLTPTVRYWYEYLFPTWFRDRDQKFYIWKQKLRSGEFNPTDTQLIKAIAEQIQQRHGNVVHRYIADFSMATDVIVSSEKGLPLCVQITTVADEYSQMKYDKWEYTLRQWNIERGLFISFNPSQEEFIVQVVNLVLYNSKNLPTQNYLKFTFGK